MKWRLVMLANLVIKDNAASAAWRYQLLLAAKYQLMAYPGWHLACGGQRPCGVSWRLQPSPAANAASLASAESRPSAGWR
jgi:hypothetical protein